MCEARENGRGTENFTVGPSWAVVAFDGGVGIAIADGSLGTLAVTNGNVDSLRGVTQEG